MPVWIVVSVRRSSRRKGVGGGVLIWAWSRRWTGARGRGPSSVSWMIISVPGEGSGDIDLGIEGD
jgi:hypothetical protein